jgi:hypothetical protein
MKASGGRRSIDHAITELYPGRYEFRWYTLTERGQWRRGVRHVDRSGAEHFARRWGTAIPSESDTDHA